MDDTRIHRRARARSYDLRRKVLLKNFLKDQMMHFPETSTELFSVHGSSEQSSSSDEESSIAEVEEQPPSFTVIDDAEQNTTSSSNDNNHVKDNDEHKIDLTDEIDVETVDNFHIPISSNHRPFSQSPGLIKFTSLFKKDSKSSSKGVFKAKKYVKNAKSPMKTRSFKRGFEKVFYGHKKTQEKSSSTHISKSSSRSLFSLFKHRREQRHTKEVDRIKRSSSNSISDNIPAKSNSINQSVQTDESWVKEEVNKVHESNKRLKEENKLLSESLSYLMSNVSTDPQIRQYSSQYQSYKNENSLMFHDYTLPPSSNNFNGWNSKYKVSRSKSVHEFNERHRVLRNNYRTKSMNVHNSRNYFLTNSRPLLSSYNDEANIPRLRKKRILTNVPNSSANRVVQRRSSMPERTLSENNRWITHGRSNSMRNAHIRKPFYALSADAFY